MTVEIHPTADIHALALVGLPGDHRDLEPSEDHPVTIGAYTVVRELCVIKRPLAGAFSDRGTSIGKHCLLMTAVHVYEGCRIEDHVEINVRATICGYVDVLERARIGAGAIIHPGVTIGAGAVVGLGSVVIEDVPPMSVVCGNPARILRAGDPTEAEMADWAFRCRRNHLPSAPIVKIDKSPV